MEKSQKIGAQIYGYTVCLVAVITFLLSVTAFVNAIIDLGDPIHSGWNAAGSPSLASFENYKMDVLKSSQKTDDTSKSSYVPDEQTLRAMYEAAKNDKILSVRHSSNRSMIISGILIFICVVLFVTHWRWMQKNTRQEA